ncbi:MAG TPA: hypothetical protein VFQ53_16380 [Kofleriaceae bacterium]|nr:hypothetical protein [Kofleriaceae bacterium]
MALGFGLAGCKKEKPGTATGVGTGSAPVASDAATTTGSGSGSGAGSGAGVAMVDAREVDPDEAAELARRKGKATGLASATEKPAVITEELVRGIASGKVDVARFLDAKQPVVERIVMPGGMDKPVPEVKRTLCGAAAEKRVVAYVKQMVEREAKDHKDELHEIGCSNAFAEQEDPEFGADEMGNKTKTVPMKHVVCSSSSAGEYDEIMRIEWVPDAARGFRIAAIVSTEGGAINKTLWYEVATAIAKPKPCK